MDRYLSIYFNVWLILKQEVEEIILRYDIIISSGCLFIKQKRIITMSNSVNGCQIGN